MSTATERSSTAVGAKETSVAALRIGAGFIFP
jgi:hypothetical protein